MLISPNANLTDNDQPFLNQATLVVSLQDGAAPGDSLSIRNQGAGDGKINVRQDQLRIGKTVIGIVEGGRDGQPLTITFNRNARLATVRSAIRQLQFSSRARDAGTRTIKFILTDGMGVAAAPVNKSIQFNAGRRR